MKCPHCLRQNILHRVGLCDNIARFRCDDCGFAWETPLEAVFAEEKERFIPCTVVEERMRVLYT